MYFSFSKLPIRRLDRQEKPFLTGPALHVWRTFGSEVEEIFWRNVPFRGAVWESWFQSHRESFNYSPLNAFRLFLGGFAYVLHKWFVWNEAQSRMDTCKYERGRACIAPAPFNFEMVSLPPPHTHTHSTTTTTAPPLPQSSPVDRVQSAALFAGMKPENPRSVLLSIVYNILWPYLFLLIICR